MKMQKTMGSRNSPTEEAAAPGVTTRFQITPQSHRDRHLVQAQKNVVDQWNTESGSKPHSSGHLIFDKGDRNIH